MWLKSILLMTLLFSCNLIGKKITIATKDFTENILLGHVLAESIKAHSNIRVNLQTELGSTFILWKALQVGDIDMYPEYSGTIYHSHLGKSKRVSAEELLRTSQQGMSEKFEIKVFEPFGFNNTYAIGMLSKLASELQITKISDLRQHTNLIAAFDSDFASRTIDGPKNLYKTYGFRPERPAIQLRNRSERYSSILEGQADYTDVYTTDDELEHSDITVLKDDLSYFSPYYSVAVIRQEVLDRFPQLEEIIVRLQNQITEVEIIHMNHKVDRDELSPKKVARAFLKSKNLIP